MPEESTPLVDKVNGLIQHENVQRAQNIATEKAKAVHKSFETGNFSLRLLVQLGSIAIIVLAFEGLYENFIHFRIAKALMEVFALALGYVILTLESSRRLFLLPDEYTTKLLTYAPCIIEITQIQLVCTFQGSESRLMQQDS